MTDNTSSGNSIYGNYAEASYSNGWTCSYDCGCPYSVQYSVGNNMVYFSVKWNNSIIRL